MKMKMKKIPTYTIGKLMLLLTLLALPLMNLASSPVQGSSLDTTTDTMTVMSAQEVVLYAKDEDAFTRVPRRAEFIRAPQTATINVTYNGFSAEAQAAFQFAVDIWASQITSDVPIEVASTFQALPTGVLGSAGPALSVRDWTTGNDAPRSGVFYPIPQANKLAGVDLIPPGNPNNLPDHDISANFSSSFTNWYFGTDGNTPAGEFDFVSVVLHELGHGLGFAGSASVSGGQGSVGSSGFPRVYDIFVENGSGQAITSFTSPSSSLASQLQSGNLFWDSPSAVAANGNSRPQLYAPNPFEQGSSYSHLDESTFSAGNPNSLMTPAIGRAETIHDPGDITRGMFQDMGWTVNSGGGSPTATPTATQIPTATPTSPPSSNPEINVDPSSLSSTQSTNTTVVKTLEIANNGSGTLTWTIDESSTTRLLEVEAYADETDAPIVAAVNSRLRSRLALVGQRDPLMTQASPAMNSSPSDTVDLILDDGTSENGIGDDGEFVWLNRFSPNAGDYPLALEEIWVEFGSSGVNAGDSIHIVVHEDTDQDGNPGTGASLLASYSTVVVAADNSTWSKYRLTNPLILNGPGDVLIGVVNRYSSEGYNDFPAGIDTSSSQGRSWIGSYASGDAPSTISYPADESWGTIDSFGYPGNWMIRGIASTSGGNSCTSGNISWASISPSSGSSSAGGSSQVSVTFDSTGLDAGTYTGNLCINSNDAQNPQVVLPLTLVVNETANPTATPTATATPVPSEAILRTHDYHVAPGNTFTMTVEAANVAAPGLSAANVTLFYDHNIIQPTTCTVDSALTGVCNSNVNGQIQFNGLSTSGLQGEFDLIDVVFQAVGQENETSALDLSTTVFADSDGHAISVTVQDGSVTIGQAVGDVSCDSLVNVVDGLYILQYDVGSRRAANSCPLASGTLLLDHCDVSKDNTCNSVDALFILQCDVGISNTFCPARFPAPPNANNQPTDIAGGATVEVGSHNVSPSSTVNVPVSVNLGHIQLGTAKIKVDFDPNIVQVTACQVANSLVGECNVDNEKGLILFNALSVSGVTGTITLAEITWQGTSAGTSSLDVGIQTFADSAGQTIAASDVDGEVNVTSASDSHTLFLPAVLR